MYSQVFEFEQSNKISNLLPEKQESTSRFLSPLTSSFVALTQHKPSFCLVIFLNRMNTIKMEESNLSLDLHNFERLELI